MKILLLTEGNLIEDKIILSRIPSKYKLDRSILSKNVSITNFFKYDLIIISFVPSLGTPHFKLIESVLRLNKVVVSMNVDQNNFHFDYAFRSNSFECLCKLGLKLFAIDENFERFLAKLNLSRDQLRMDNFNSIEEENDKSCLSNNLIFIFDLRWTAASDKYIRYKRGVGYSDSAIRGAINYSSSYMGSFIANYEKILNKFQFKRACIYIDSLISFEEIKVNFRGKFLGDIEIVDAQMLLKLLEEDSVILTNWHSIGLIKSRESLKVYRINFLYQNSVNYFKQVPPDQCAGEKLLNITDEKFELIRIKSNLMVINIEAICSGCKNSEISILGKPGAYIGSAVNAFGLVRNSVILIVIQLRFLLYNFKSLIINIQLRRFVA